MRIVIAPDSFKECMTAAEAADAMEKGIRSALPDAECIKIPMADGGEGTVDSLVLATGGRKISCEASGPDGEPLTAEYGILGDGKTAVLEIAACCGIHLVHGEKRNPLLTTTYGVGLMIRHILDAGYQKVIAGLGGSCTNDGGAGMLSALGAVFEDDKGNEIAKGGGALGKLARIDVSCLDGRIRTAKFIIACDVTCPLTGENGASRVFAPQKGATPETVRLLDRNLKHYASVIRDELKIETDFAAGTGAAGGLGAAFLGFFNSEMRSGIDVMSEYTGLENKIASADFVFTGEGGVNGQTVLGKTPYGIGKLAKSKNVPAVIFAGKVDGCTKALRTVGIDRVICITPAGMPSETALRRGKENLTRAVSEYVRNLRQP